jgi:hypothetical protein
VSVNHPNRCSLIIGPNTNFREACNYNEGEAVLRKAFLKEALAKKVLIEFWKVSMPKIQLVTKNPLSINDKVNR